MSVINSNVLLMGDDGYTISRSVRLRSSASAYLSRTFGAPTSNTVWTFSVWLKKAITTTSHGIFSNSDGYSGTYYNSSDVFRVMDNAGGVASVTTAVYRDYAAWGHLVIKSDGTYIKTYWNGVEVASYTGTVTNMNKSGQTYHIGRYNTSYFDGYMTEIYFVDGQGLAPSSFGETDLITGVWKPKKYSGSYGNNGFYLNFSDNSAATAAAIGKDSSGNGNNWTPNNISVTAGATYDSMTDVPTLGATASNYAVLNPLDKGGATTLTAGNLNNDYSGTATDSLSFSTIAFDVATSQFYAEFTYVSSSLTGSGIPGVGVADVSTVGTANISTAGTSVYYLDDGTKTVNGTNSAFGATWTTGDVIGVYVNNGTITFYKNGASQGNAATGLTGTYKFVVRGRSGTSRTFTIAANFGQRAFGNLPTGAKALNTFNLPDPTIKKGNQYFDVVKSTATVSTGATISGLAFSPDLLWRKNRDNVESHYLVDSVRGTGSGGFLSSNSTSAAGGYPGGDGTLTFNSDGYTITDSNWNAGEFYFNGRTYVDWLWKKGATSGFDIQLYNKNASSVVVSHSLGVAPAMIILKSRSAGASSYNWYTYHQKLSSGYIVVLNGTAAAGSSPNLFTSIGSSSFTIGSDYTADSNGVAYLFSEVAGFSKFGSYTGNNNADGPFVYCGFRPRYVMIRRTDSANWWLIYDTARNTYNVQSNYLQAESSNYENNNGASPVSFLDTLSNGFKLRDSGIAYNASGGTYIFAAFAENPFKYSLAR